MKSNTDLTNNLLLNSVSQLFTDPYELNEQQKFAVAEFLNKESDGAICKELVLKCFRNPSEVTPEERSRLTDYRAELEEGLDLTLRRLFSSTLEKLKCNFSDYVSGTITEDVSGVKTDPEDQVNRLLHATPDLEENLIQDFRGSSLAHVEQRGMLGDDSMDTLGNQEDEAS